MPIRARWRSWKKCRKRPVGKCSGLSCGGWHERYQRDGARRTLELWRDDSFATYTEGTGSNAAPTEEPTLVRMIAGRRFRSWALRIAWATIFGIAGRKRVSAPAVLRVTICESTVGSVTQSGIRSRCFCPPRSPLRQAPPERGKQMCDRLARREAENTEHRLLRARCKRPCNRRYELSPSHRCPQSPGQRHLGTPCPGGLPCSGPLWPSAPIRFVLVQWRR
jgi:hypothetical protein